MAFLLSRSAPLAARQQAPRCKASSCRVVSVRAASLEFATKAPKAEPAAAEPAPSAALDPELPDVQPNTKEVTRFISTLVSETSIAELHLQVGNFELKVRRSTGALPAAPSPSAPQAYAPPTPYSAPETLVITKAPPMDTLKMTLDESMDESIVPIHSPKVGVFRRGKYVGGKRVGKGNQINVGDSVKKGQALAYVEQLGTFVPVEAPQAGEVTKFLLEEGAPVEYRQEVVELAPFFGGHIIGDSKYA